MLAADVNVSHSLEDCQQSVGGNKERAASVLDKLLDQFWPYYPRKGWRTTSISTALNAVCQRCYQPIGTGRRARLFCSDRQTGQSTASRRRLTAAAQRLHHNVLATALANKLARIALTVLVRARG